MMRQPCYNDWGIGLSAKASHGCLGVSQISDFCDTMEAVLSVGQWNAQRHL